MSSEPRKRGETFSGIKGIAMQDGSLQESMADRGPHKENWSPRIAGSSWPAASCGLPSSAAR